MYYAMAFFVALISIWIILLCHLLHTIRWSADSVHQCPHYRYLMCHRMVRVKRYVWMASMMLSVRCPRPPSFFSFLSCIHLMPNCFCTWPTHSSFEMATDYVFFSVSRLLSHHPISLVCSKGCVDFWLVQRGQSTCTLHGTRCIY